MRSIEPAVRIVFEKYAGGADGYQSYSVAIAAGAYLYCFRASYDYSRDASGKRIDGTDGHPVAGEITRVRTRTTLFDPRSEQVLQSTFPGDQDSYREAVALAVSFYSKAQMLFPRAPVRWVRFDRSERVDPKSFEVTGGV